MNDPRKVDTIGRWVAVALVVVFLGLVTMYTIRPLLSARKNLGAFAEAVDILGNADTSIARLSFEVDIITRKIEKSEAMLPKNVDLDAFLEQLSAIAASADVHIEKFTPQQVTQHRLCHELPLDLQISGSFPAIYAFVAELETGNRLSRIERMTVQRNDSRDLCQAQMRLALFFARQQAG